MGQMGIGFLGQPSKIIKRKFRYTLSIKSPAGDVPIHYVKTAARPNLDVDELELNFLNGVHWIAGKGKWQPITVTYVDVSDQVMGPLWSWITNVYTITNPDNCFQSEPKGYMGTATLTLLDGCGSEIEHWDLIRCWPKSVNFGDLAYAESDEVTIELSLRYSGVIYHAGCGGPSPEENCQGCSGGGSSRGDIMASDLWDHPIA
jgi:hypothetical protein